MEILLTDSALKEVKAYLQENKLENHYVRLYISSFG
jgi:Fe-S cluster assembly iron-binding protein IscA